VNKPCHQRLGVFDKVPTARAGDVFREILQKSLAVRRRLFPALNAPPLDPTRGIRVVITWNLIPEHDRDYELGGDAQVHAHRHQRLTRGSLARSSARSDSRRREL
jgi:hypothetical protein